MKCFRFGVWVNQLLLCKNNCKISKNWNVERLIGDHRLWSKFEILRIDDAHIIMNGNLQEKISLCWNSATFWIFLCNRNMSQHIDDSQLSLSRNKSRDNNRVATDFWSKCMTKTWREEYKNNNFRSEVSQPEQDCPEHAKPLTRNFNLSHEFDQCNQFQTIQLLSGNTSKD